MTKFSNNLEINSDKILLHACCAICSGHPICMLKSQGIEPVVYFYNPNIQPYEEYQKRLIAQEKLCEKFGCELIAEDYKTEDFENAVCGLESEPEGGKRCEKCFRLRLERSAKKACELGLDNFTTSIVISPHKNFKLISEIGMKISEEYGIKYLAVDFKKQDGVLKTNKISRELELYRQNYCGCRFSIRK